MNNSFNWCHTTTLRCFAIVGEAYVSHLIRLANLNVTSVCNILNSPAANIRNLRDYGFGVERYCKYMGMEDELDVRNNRTLLPYLWCDKYRPSLPSKISDQTIARMLHHSNANGEVLRFCPSCFSQDFQNNGYGIWRIRHQLPVTYYCSLHNQALIDVSMKWLRLPSNCDLKNHNYNKQNIFLSSLADEDWNIFSISNIPNSRFEQIEVIRKWLCKELRGKIEIEKFSTKIRNALPNDLRLGIYKFPTIEHGVHSLICSNECFISNEILALLSVQYKAAI